ncbi:MAG: DUF4412 domain-containing protein [Bacteroidales bacterium]
MRNLLVFIGLALLLNSCNSESDSKKNEEVNKKYKIESGIIQYRLDMMGVQSNLTVYFKEYGNVEASTTEAEILGEKTAIVTLQKDNYYYTYTPAKKSGTKIKMEEGQITDESGARKMTETDIINLGGKKTGSEMVLGKECNIYSLTDNGTETKVWVWNNMFLKSIASFNGMEMKMEVLEIRETKDFPAGIFDVPLDVKFIEPQIEPDSIPDFENPEAEG